MMRGAIVQMFVAMFCIGYSMAYINSTECALCESLIDIIDFEFFRLNKSVESIIRVTEAICESIPGPGAKECIFVVDNIQNIINDLNHTMNASQICHNITLGFNHSLC